MNFCIIIASTDEIKRIFMLAITHFDTHRYVKKLTARNFTEDQAEALVDFTIEVVEVKNADTISRAEDTVFKSEMKADFAGLRNDMDARLSDIRNDMDARLSDIRKDMDLGFAHVDAKFAHLETSMIRWVLSVGTIIIGLLVTLLTRLPH